MLGTLTLERILVPSASFGPLMPIYEREVWQ